MPQSHELAHLVSTQAVMIRVLWPFNIGIKHDFPFIKIRKVPREVLKTEGEARCFQHLPRDFANVNE